MPVTQRGPARLLATPGAVRAQALVIVAMLQVGVAAAISAPASPAAAPRPVAVERARLFSDRPVAGALRELEASVRGSVPSAVRTGIPSSPEPFGIAPPVAPTTTTAPAAKFGKRYVPTGTGMWTYMWDETEGGSARRIVQKAKDTGLSHLYVRTGTRQGGFVGGPMLRELLPATSGTDIKVIAWDFPQLVHPIRDAQRLAAAAKFRVPGAPRVAAVAPDIETTAEGTKLTGKRVTLYMSTLRRLLPDDVSIIGVVPWPSEHRVGKYPFARVARYSDAIAPMAYWINRDPATVARQTMQRLRVFKKPVLPIGQAYDPRIDVPTLKWGPPSRWQVKEFLDTAKRYGAPSASLWVWQFASDGQWQALKSARAQFGPAGK